MAETKKIVLVDDHWVLRASLAALIAGDPGLEVVGECGDALTGVEMARTLEPHLILMDIDMPGMDSFSAMAVIRKELPDCAVVLLSAFWPEIHVRQALSLGVAGYLTKHESAKGLLEHLHAILGGGKRYSEEVAVRIAAIERESEQPADQGRMAALTIRELELVRYIAGGTSRKEAAEMMGISEVTVGSTLRGVMSKLGLRNRIDLARVAIQEGLVRP